MTALRMLENDQTRNKLKLLENESHNKLGKSLLAGLPSKRVSFLGLSVLLLFTIFSLAHMTILEYGLRWNLHAEGSGSLSSDHDSTPWMSRVSRRQLQHAPTVGATLTATPTELPTTPTSIPTQLPATPILNSTRPTTIPTRNSTQLPTTPTPIPTQLSTTSTLPNLSPLTASTTTQLAKLAQPTPTTAESATIVRNTSLFSQKATRRPNDVSRYVSFSSEITDGRRLGNQIFCFAAVLYVAQLTGREPAITNFRNAIALDYVFDLNVERFDSLCPCSLVGESKSLSFDEQTDKKVLENQDTTNKSILVNGFRQSWRYTLAIDRRLRRHLVFKEEIRKFAEEYLEKHIPPGWTRAGFLRVAIHARRGDIILQKTLVNFGYTVPNVTYFRKAMNYFFKRYGRVQFITFSEDEKWVSENIHADKNRTQDVHVTHSVSHSAGQDLAIMSMCDHVIMSTGTFGWWGGWLAKGTTVYYSNWPRMNSPLRQHFTREDFFPPNWIPMGD